jgi:hypothetical protein
MNFDSLLLLRPATVAQRSIRSRGRRDGGFESNSWHECLIVCVVCAFFYVCVQAEALRRADCPSKETCRLS